MAVQYTAGAVPAGGCERRVRRAGGVIDLLLFAARGNIAVDMALA